MAKYQVEHTCGHTVTHSLFGKLKGRDLAIQRLRQEDCPECDSAQWWAARIAKYPANSAAAGAAGFATLQGSERQVAWAECVRQSFVQAVVEAEQALEPAKARPEKLTEAERKAIPCLEQTLSEMRARTNASEWIDLKSYANVSAAKGVITSRMRHLMTAI